MHRECVVSFPLLQTNKKEVCAAAGKLHSIRFCPDTVTVVVVGRLSAAVKVYNQSYVSVDAQPRRSLSRLSDLLAYIQALLPVGWYG